jgi:LysM repeat protein
MNQTFLLDFSYQRGWWILTLSILLPWMDLSASTLPLIERFHQLQNQVQNHEAELRTFEDRFQNQEEIVDSLRKQTQEAIRNIHEAQNNQRKLWEAKWANQENATKEMALGLKSYASDSAAILEEYRKRILELEKIIEIQNRNIENLQVSLRSFLAAFHSKEAEPVSASSPQLYSVKAGDSLEKIARAHKTSIKKLKELNQLTGDHIIIGQKLRLSE